MIYCETTIRQLQTNVSGAYAIYFLEDPTKVYIGSSKAIRSRFREHIRTLKLNQHRSITLQKAANDLLDYTLKLVVLEETTDTSTLFKLEQFYLNQFEKDKIFNICQKAGNFEGCKHTENTKSKMSIVRKGKQFSDTHKSNLSLSLKGNQRSKGNIGSKRNEESKQKMSLAAKGHKKSTGSKNSMAKLNEIDVYFIKGLLGTGYTLTKISLLYSVSIGTVSLIKNNKSWAHIRR